MKKLKKLGTALVLALTLMMTVPGMNQTIAVEAATTTVKINKKTATLTVGKTLQLQVTGTKQKIVWSTSSKSVATVDTKGKVKAKKAGKAVITATVSKKKYTCTVTVKAAPAKTSIETPFEQVTATYSGYNFVMPKSWEKGDSVAGISLYPKTEGSDRTIVNILASAMPMQMDYNSLESICIDILITQLKDAGIELNKENIVTSEKECKIGTAMKVEYSLTQSGETAQFVIFIISTPDQLIEIVATDIKSGVDPDGLTVAKYVFLSLEKADSTKAK